MNGPAASVDDNHVDISVDFLRDTYPALRAIDEALLGKVVEDLAKDWVFKKAHLDMLSRQALVERKLPMLFVEVVKPPPPQDVMKPPSPQKKQRTSKEINAKSLVLPTHVVPPAPDPKPDFISVNWLEDAIVRVICGLQNTDDRRAENNRDNDMLKRNPPLGLARCSRGGKSRALKEIAAKCRNHPINGFDVVDDTPVAVKPTLTCIYVCFNDTTSIEPWEQDDPLQALLRRIAFGAAAKTEEKPQSFASFMEDRPTWDMASFLEWIGNTPCLLLIDELNLLKKFTERGSLEASNFGIFLKKYFIGMENRYLVFSSHLLGTLNFFSRYLDSSEASSRHVELLDLPLVPSLQQAVGLKKGLNSVREAVYYGLIPGIIFESTEQIIKGKRHELVSKALDTNSDRLDICFLAILRSIIVGKLDNDNFPHELSLLLDSVQREPEEVDEVRWIPFHLQYVFEQFGAKQDFIHAGLSKTMASLCNLLKDAKELSGEGWEGLFVLFLIVRGLSGEPDDFFIPKWWFDQIPGDLEVVYNNYNALLNQTRLIGDCKTWDQLKPGVPVPHDRKRMNVFYPTHNNFEVYDVIVIFSVNGVVKQRLGYQLKEGKSSNKPTAHPDMTSSFFIQGRPPQHTLQNGWTVVDNRLIDSFFGVSGMQWTPMSWRQFRNQNS